MMRQPHPTWPVCSCASWAPARATPRTSGAPPKQCSGLLLQPHDKHSLLCWPLLSSPWGPLPPPGTLKRLPSCQGTRVHCRNYFMSLFFVPNSTCSSEVLQQCDSSVSLATGARQHWRCGRTRPFGCLSVGRTRSASCCASPWCGRARLTASSCRARPPTACLACQVPALSRRLLIV